MNEQPVNGTHVATAVPQEQQQHRIISPNLHHPQEFKAAKPTTIATTTKNLPDLQKELATLERVRNRLVSTPNQDLPKVLNALLPKLLSRINETASFCVAAAVAGGGNDDDSEAQADVAIAISSETTAISTTTHNNNNDHDKAVTEIRLGMMDHLRGMFLHLRERIQLHPAIVAGDNAMWIHSLWQAVIIPDVNNASTTESTTTTRTTMEVKESNPQQQQQQSHHHHHPETIYLVLLLLEQAHASCARPNDDDDVYHSNKNDKYNNSATNHSFLVPLIRLLDQLHADMLQMMGPELREEPTPAAPSSSLSLSSVRQENWTRAGWMVIDEICQAAGIPVILDFDRDGVDLLVTSGDNSSPQKKKLDWTQTESAPAAAPEIVEAVRSSSFHGNGIFHLLQDIMLFHPNEQQQYNHGGLGAAGVERMQYRRRPQDDMLNQRHGSVEEPRARLLLQRQHQQQQQQRQNAGHGARPVRFRQRARHTQNGHWTDSELTYLRHIKLACMRYAVWPIKQGLLSPEKALLFCAIHANVNTRHGKIAADYMWQRVGGRKLVKLGQRFVNPKPPPCPLSNATSLIAIVVGEAKAVSVLEKTPGGTLALPWIGKLTKHVSMQRSPLAATDALRVLEYLSECINLTTETPTDALRLFVELALAVPELLHQQNYQDEQIMTVDPASARLSPGLRWMTHMWYLLFHNYALSSDHNDSYAEWVTFLQNQCWDASIAVVSKVNDDDDRRLHASRWRRVNRHTTARLIYENRRQMGQRSAVLTDCIRTRSEAYEMFGRLIRTRSIRTESGAIDFGPLITLMKCLANDNHCDVHKNLRDAAKKSTLVYKKEAESIVMEHQESRRLINALLFPLIGAATSTNQAARELAVMVTNDVLAKLDLLPARHLCAFLTQDTAPAVRDMAKKALKTFDLPTEDLAKGINVEFLGIQSEVLRDDLLSRMSLISSTVGVSPDAAFFLLQKGCFSVTETVAALQSDSETFVKDCGVENRLLNRNRSSRLLKQSRTSVENICEICYETVSESKMFGLPCDHHFCLDCWKDCIDAAFADGKVDMEMLKCPQHQCREHVTRDDVATLSPQRLFSFDEAILEIFVQRCPEYSFCPGPDCTAVARLGVDLSASKNHPASCTHCQTIFCFQCGSTPHRPASCEIVKRYETIMQEFKELEHIMKECPNCNVRIQKNGGCNHVRDLIDYESFYI